MAHELWRDVVGYEGLYQVSNFGRVKGIERYVLIQCPSGSSYYRHIPEIIRKQGIGSVGYANVVLSKHGVHHTKDVHRIVANAFLPNPEHLSCIDHINGNKLDNRVVNLRWVTQKDNIHYSIENGSMDIKARTAILQDIRVREACLEVSRKPVIRSDNKIYKSITEAAIDTGCSRQAISHVLRGINKTCKGFTFSYLT